MRFASCAVLTFLGLSLGLSATASAVTVNYAGAGTANGQAVNPTYGSSSTATFTYRSLNGGNNWGQNATTSTNTVNYWSGAYSGQAAIYANQNSNKLEVNVSAPNKYRMDTLSLRLGGYANANRTVTYKIYDAFWKLIASGTNVAVNNTAGLMISLASLNTKSVHFQMGDDWNVGLNNLTYTTLYSPVPVPASVWFMGSALLGLGAFARARRSARV